MEERVKRPGSVRLTEEQYEEMEELGIESESAYVNFKLNGHKPAAPMQVSRQENEAENHQTVGGALADKLLLQKLEMENQLLQEKLQSFEQTKEETLSGIPHKVNHMLQEELMKRDHEALKRDNASLQKQVEKLETALEKAEEKAEEKQEEIQELVKKLGLIEVGKALLPSAISGLAKKFPRELQGVASTLGALAGEEQALLSQGSRLSEEDAQLLNLMQSIRELFSEAQFEEVIQLVFLLAEQLKGDENLLGKVRYYLHQLQKVKKTGSNSSESDIIN